MPSLEELKYLFLIERILILLDIIVLSKKRFRLTILDNGILRMILQDIKVVRMSCFVERNQSAIKNTLVYHSNNSIMIQDMITRRTNSHTVMPL